MSASQARYSKIAIWLHWLIAALIIANLAIGLLRGYMDEETRRFWMSQHFAIGLSVLIFSVLRLIWRLVHPVPPPASDHAAWERFLARVIHIMFYALMLIVPVIGWLIVSTGNGRPIDMFGLFEIPALPAERSREAHDFYELWHEILAKAWIGLIVLHIAGALKHHMIDRDTTLARMLPFLGRERV